MPESAFRGDRYPAECQRDMPTNWTLALLLVATSLVAAVSALLIIAAFLPRQRRPRRLADVEPPLEEAVFLFDDDTLVDATPPARALMELTQPRGSDWARLSAFLAPRLPGLDQQLASLAERGTVELASGGDRPLQLRAEHLQGLARITVTDPLAEGRGTMVDALSLRAMEDEIAQLRAMTETNPAPAWHQNAAGDVIWANRAYLALADSLEAEPGAEPCPWPLPRLFDLGPDPAAGNGGPRRLRLEAADGTTRWFDCRSFADGATGGQTAGAASFAIPADSTVRAETALREFVQTLTKTFAHLPIGLAIFDRQRQLALFNPALIDLTTLDAEFLSARPTLFAFLDRLRESRMIPEPKDYRSWRMQMTALEKAASTGLYQETWALPSGLTYQVTGRPHPDGAVAIMIEDITSEITLTRRFRSDLELGQAVFDSLPEAIAVFSPDGTLALSNAAYASLWDFNPENILGGGTIDDALGLWKQRGAAEAIWDELAERVSEDTAREAWAGRARLADGSPVIIRTQPVAGGATLVAFRPGRAAGRGLRRLRLPRSLVDAATQAGADKPMQDEGTANGDILILDHPLNGASTHHA